MSAARISPPKFSKKLADAAIIYGGVILAMYLRLGLDGPPYELNERNGWLKIGLVSLVCIINLYFYDLYDYIVMTNRRELLLRMVQALGIAWAFLAFLFYLAPPLMVGRGVSMIAVALVLVLLLALRIGIHILSGHPEIGD